jgi:hypothetical protein
VGPVTVPSLSVRYGWQTCEFTRAIRRPDDGVTLGFEDSTPLDTPGETRRDAGE